MAIIGYARTSTSEQEAGLEAQIRDLKAAGCERIFSEQVSSIAQREKLQLALDYVREDDVLVVCKLDRLARSNRHLWQLIEELRRRKVGLRILNLGGSRVDTKGAVGRMLLNIFSAFAQFEREIMLERQREGIAKAKADGKYKGRKPTARAKTADILRLKAEGKGATAIASELGIGRASVYRALEG